MATTIFLTRHGLSSHNLTHHVFMGRAPESVLVEEGKQEARLLGGRLALEGQIDAIICSSLPRTRETAEIIAAACSLESPQGEDAFWELSKGDWEGVMSNPPPEDQAMALEKNPFSFVFGNGGESYADVVARVVPAFQKWVAAYNGKRILFVLHGDVLRALFYHLIGFPKEKIHDFQTNPCAISEFQLGEGGGVRVIRLNDAAHTSKQK